MRLGKWIGGAVLTAAAMALGAGVGVPNTAEAQSIQINIGGSPAKAKRALVANGYDQIEVFKVGLKSVRAKACKDGVLWEVKVSTKNRIKPVRKIGNCGRYVTADQVRAQLERGGMERVLVEAQNGYYVAVGCRGTVRQRVIVSEQGKVERQRRLGSCAPELAPADIIPILRKQKYNRIQFTDRQLPWYRAQACLNNQRVEVLLTRRGEVRRQEVIGRCSPPIKPQSIQAVMQKKGYTQVSVIDDRLPGYVAEACKNDKRIEVTLNRFGDIARQVPLGDCYRPLERKQLVSLLREEGYQLIAFQRPSRDGSVFSACFEDQSYLINVSDFGDLINEKDNGPCVGPPVTRVSERLKKRGLSDVKFYAEACRGKLRVRIAFNKYGEFLGRERIGNC